jgi:hypothetical protein
VGASNVAKVFTYWPDLKHRDKVGLIFMANTALDADDPPVYWGGWEALGRALGFDPGDGTDERAAANASEQVRRVIASLAKSGVVVSSARARTHIRAEYALALEPAHTFKATGTGRQVVWVRIPRPISPTEKVGQVPPERCPSFHQKGGNSPTKKVPPRRTEEPLEENRKEESVGKVPTSPRDRRNFAMNDASPEREPTIQEQREWQSRLLLQRQAEYEKTMRETA